ncbi:ankyrin repeat-containing domain protein [Pelagophyceae sp. CCMP2097]|nr:ankyrin repeat-containing domain protein [Pelagophyceae sp. CCMP2097]
MEASPQLVNFRDYDRRSPLHVAASEGNLELVKYLSAHGARLNTSDRWGGSALDDALRHRQHEVAVFLRGCGASLGSGDHTLALISAAAGGQLREVIEMVDLDHADVNGRDYVRFCKAR